MNNIFRNNLILINTTILCIFEFGVLFIPSQLFAYYYIAFGYIVFPLILVYSSYRTLKFKNSKYYNLILIITLFLIHIIFYAIGIKYLMFDNFYKKYPVFVVLYEGVTAGILLSIFEGLYKILNLKFLMYAFISGVLSLGFGWILSKFIGGGYPIFNYIFWQLNISIIINAYIYNHLITKNSPQLIN